MKNEEKMTPEEAIAEISFLKVAVNKVMEQALDMAILALSQEPCDDVVSRQAVLNAIEHEDKWLLAAKGHNGLTEIAFSGLKARVDALPPVTQKSGKWIRWREEVQRGTHYTENIPHCKCSECGKEYDIFASRFINYCPNCGAKMVEPQESEDK